MRFLLIGLFTTWIQFQLISETTDTKLLSNKLSPQTDAKIAITSLSPTPYDKSEGYLKCPAEVQTLSDLMLKDLPSYANRVIQRGRRLSKRAKVDDIFIYVVAAGRPEFEPIPLNNLEYQSVFSESPKQIFFTTLERQNIGKKIVENQNYHWLFLTQTTSGWRMVTIFSRFGFSAEGQPPTPPKESSDGIIGQAVSLWLRDCRAGAIRIN